MKFVYLGLAIFLLAPVMAWAAPPPSDASLKELMQLTELRKLVEAMPERVSSSMDVYAQHVLQALQGGKAATSRQRQAIDDMKKRMVALYANEISYDRMEPLWLPLYRETFSDEEVAGMIAFYKTPAGQSMIHKMPALMKNVMQMQQRVMSQLMPKIQEMSQDFAKEMKAANETTEPSGAKGRNEASE